MAYIVPIKSQTDMNIVASTLHSAGYSLYRRNGVVVPPRIGGNVRIWDSMKHAKLDTNLRPWVGDTVWEPSDLYRLLSA